MFISNLTNQAYYLEDEKNNINNKINALRVNLLLFIYNYILTLLNLFFNKNKNKKLLN
jgi:hypothetical protein